MSLSRSLWLAVFLLCGTATAFAGSSQHCFTPAQAMHKLNQDICVKAHVYDVVQLVTGTRFLDLCSPKTPDQRCRFTIISLPEDRKQAGDLSQYKGQTVRVRGTVRPMKDRAAIFLSDARQFQGERSRFRPNPLLGRRFDPGQDRPPVNDPNLRHHGGRQVFMNPHDQETLPSASK